GDVELRRQIPLTSANSVNIGRLLPQTIYYFHAVAQYDAAVSSRRPAADKLTFCTPSGNFGNLTAGLLAKRAGLGIDRFIAATNINDVVPTYLSTGEFRPRASESTIANAMDVGHPSNFERMTWLYHQNLEAIRKDVSGARYVDEDVR